MHNAGNRPLVTLTETQNRIVAATLTFFCAAVLAIGLVTLVWLALKVLGYFLHIVGPVIVAFFLSLLTRPWYARLKGWFGGRDFPTVIVFALSFLIPLVLLVWFFGSFFYAQAAALIEAMPVWLEQLRAALIELFPNTKDVVQRMLPTLPELLSANGAGVAQIAERVADTGVSMGGVALAIGGMVFSVGAKALLWLLTFFYWILFVMQRPMTGESFASRLPFLGARGRRAVAKYFRDFNDIVVSYFRGQFIDVFLQGLLYGTGFQLLGLPNGFLIGFVLGLMNLMPYVGATLGLCVALPVAFVDGGIWLTVGVFAVFCCVQTFDGYVMQPYIQGNRMKLAAWQIVFALLFWTQLGGFLGLLLAIPLTAFVKASWDGWRALSERFVGSDGETEGDRA